MLLVVASKRREIGASKTRCTETKSRACLLLLYRSNRCPPSFSTMRFPRPKSVSVLFKFHMRHRLRKSWQLQNEAVQVEPNICPCTSEVKLFPITRCGYCICACVCVRRADSCQVLGNLTISSLLFNCSSIRLRRQTVRHVKVKDWH